MDDNAQSQPVATNETLDGIAARLEIIEAETQVDYYTSLLQELDTETDGEVFAASSDLKLASRCIILGAWRAHESTNTYYENRVVPLLKNPDGTELNGFKIFAFLEDELAGMLTQSSDNAHVLGEMRAEFASDKKFQSVMGLLDAEALDPAARRTLKIAAAGLLAGAALYDRPNRFENLKQVLA